MKPLFFLYVWLNLTRPECFRDKENLVKHIRKITIQTGRLFFSSSLNTLFNKVKFPNSLFVQTLVTFLRFIYLVLESYESYDEYE